MPLDYPARRRANTSTRTNCERPRDALPQTSQQNQENPQAGIPCADEDQGRAEDDQPQASNGSLTERSLKRFQHVAEPSTNESRIDTHTPGVVVLIGLRGSGKTTIGRALAERLQRPWSDLDQRALALCDEATIQDVFDGPGAARWRAAEAEALEVALADHPSVLSLGGGAPTVAAVRDQLNTARTQRHARVIWLDASSECLARRIGKHDQQRPPLCTHADGAPLNPLEESQLLREQRSETYRALSDQIVDTEPPLDEVLDRIIAPG